MLDPVRIEYREDTFLADFGPTGLFVLWIAILDEMPNAEGQFVFGVFIDALAVSLMDLRKSYLELHSCLLIKSAWADNIQR